MLRRIFLVIAVALTPGACQTSSVVDARDLMLLAKAEARWSTRPFADYDYEIRVLCFCPPEINRWTRVAVRGGMVTAAEPVEPDPNFPVTSIQYWEPIDSIFADLHRSMSESSGGRTYLAAIIVDYDRVLGYPTNIEYRAKPNVADGGAVFSLRNVRPAQ